MWPMTLGKRIIKARDRKGWDRRQLAEAARVPYPTLAGLENEDQATSKWTPALAAALGVNALWLADGKGPMLNGSETSPESESPSQKSLASQSDGLNADILLMASRWALIFEAADVEPWTDTRRKKKEIKVYTDLMAGGGRLSDELFAEYLSEMNSSRPQKKGLEGGEDERGDRAAGSRSARRGGGKG